jgi:hypothetical protein
MCQRIQPWPKNITHCSVTIVFMQTNPITNCVFWPLEAPSLDLYDSLYDCTLNMRCFDHQRQDATCAHGRFNNVSCVQISIVYDDSFVNLQGNWFGWSSSPRVWNSSTMTSCPLCTPSCQSTLLESTCTWRLSPVSTHAQTHTHTPMTEIQATFTSNRQVLHQVPKLVSRSGARPQEKAAYLGNVLWIVMTYVTYRLCVGLSNNYYSKGCLGYSLVFVATKRPHYNPTRRL